MKMNKKWDAIYLTASNDEQKSSFELELMNRKDLSLYTDLIRIIPDIDGKRIGSGGATFSVLKQFEMDFQLTNISEKRILIIHSGGDSKRIPQYSCIGKLFSPVMKELKNGNGSTLFDELIDKFSKFPSKMDPGALVISGDVLLDFNYDDVSFPVCDAFGIAFLENVNTGSQHGVYLCRESLVDEFLHKKSVEELRCNGAVNSNNQVFIDTGAIFLSSNIINSLVLLISNNENYHLFVDEKTRLSFYGDLIYPLSNNSSLDVYLKLNGENGILPNLIEARLLLWRALNCFKMHVLKFADGRFIHFGTTNEFHYLICNNLNKYRECGWSNKVLSYDKNDRCKCYESLVLSANVGKNVYAEFSIIDETAIIGDNVILSNTHITYQTIPSNVVIHSIRLKNGMFVTRIYGINDNPKKNMIFGKIKLKENLWDCHLYKECFSLNESLDSSLSLYKTLISNNNFDFNSCLHSLNSSFNLSDNCLFQKSKNTILSLIEIYKVSFYSENDKQVIDIDCSNSEIGFLSDSQKIFIMNYIENSDKTWFMKMKFLYYVGYYFNIDEYFTLGLKFLRRLLLIDSKNNNSLKISNPVSKCSLPLRINFAGGWSDTSPFSNVAGGCVLNASIKINKSYPVCVSFTKNNLQCIVLKSNDMNTYKEFRDINELQETGDPNDLFALQKSVLIACGLIPLSGGNLDSILDLIGGGFTFETNVMNVPKGSGLGTSSILSAASVRAFYSFFGLEYSDEIVKDKVIQIEQIMTTGGGWQDQIGGLIKGFKLISSKPGIEQRLTIERIKINKHFEKELCERFALVSTGQKRLARNILRDVIEGFVLNKGLVKDSLYRIKEIALEMSNCMKSGDFSKFVLLMNEHYNCLNNINKNISNKHINDIFDSINDLIDGKMICGAGGGGFLQIILKKNVSIDTINDRLQKHFPNQDISVWDSEFEFD